MEEKEITNPVKAIRAKCLDCCCGSSNEGELCTCTGCALYPFRRGKNPYRKNMSYPKSREPRLWRKLSRIRSIIAAIKTQTIQGYKHPTPNRFAAQPHLIRGGNGSETILTTIRHHERRKP